MAKPRQKFAPSAELLDWIEGLIVQHLTQHDNTAYWSHIQGHISYVGRSGPQEWIDMTGYAKTKAFNLVLDRMTERRVIYRTKNFHPYHLLNPLDLIVEALDRADDGQPPTTTD